MNLRPAIVAVLLAAGTLVPGATAIRAADKDEGPPNDPTKVLPIRVNQAIDSGVEWLKKQVYAGGNWEDKITGNRLYDPEAKGEVYTHPAGCTALALYTLLKCGVPAKDPVIVKGFEWLKKNAGLIKSKGVGLAGGGEKAGVPRGSYEISVLVLALEAKANPHKREKDRIKDAEFHLKKGQKLKTNVKLDKEDQVWMKDLLDALMDRRKKSGPGWRYNVSAGNGSYNKAVRGDTDMSSTQLAMLAFLAGERCGFTVPDSFYLDILKWTLAEQEDTGPKVRRFDPMRRASDDEQYGDSTAVMDEARGWAYMKRSTDEGETRVTTSMTSCGLANVLICTSTLQARENADYLSQWAAKAEKAWYDGNAWYQEHWDITRNVNTSGTNGYHLYALYCLERVGDLKGVNLLGGHPWYSEGAKYLVDSQQMGGFWREKDTHEPEDILNTCFALLFLNRATPAITGD